MADYNNENAFIVVPPPFQPPPNFSPSALATPFAPSPSAAAPESSSPSPPPPAASSPPPAEESAPSAEVDATPDASASNEAASAAEPAVQQASSHREFVPQQQQPFARRANQFGPGAGFQKKWPVGAKKWTGGSPPPCVYFARNLCRNGDICRFPHLRADGTDARLPGIIDGSLPAAPVSTMSSKPVSANNRHSMGAAATAPTDLDSSLESLPTSTSDLTSSLPSLASSGVASGEETPTGPRYIPSASTPAFVPAPRNPNPNHLSNQPFHPSNLNRPMMFPNNNQFNNQQPRSAPTTRPVSPQGGFAGRSASVQPPRRKEDGHPTVSAAARQRVPSSEDFPALGGGAASTGSLGGSGVLVGGGKTAAQVLSGPAPKVAPVKKQQQVKKAPATVEEDAKSASSAELVHASDAGSEEDAVLVSSSAKTAPSAPNGAPSPAPMAVKKGPVLSFAGAAGALVGAKA